ncbi:MAG TPA: SRPBCC domain-containing protein [Streptosporangiaceae bacterium]|jgi:hypothetical protein|nr:SRPBCC domain-containing protein [Streptosporangiaceae bacterium]
MKNMPPAGLEPIRCAITVEAGQERTFTTFTRRIGSWWPIETRAIEPGKVKDVVVEEHAGGRVYELLQDGSECDWGHIIRWEPPSFFSLTWEVLPGPVFSVVELDFKRLGPARTQVELTHRGWESLAPVLQEYYAPHKAAWPHIIGLFENIFSAGTGATTTDEADEAAECPGLPPRSDGQPDPP